MNLNRKNRLEKLLNERFQAKHLEVINESHMHRVPEHAETHFKLIIVSQSFKDLTRIHRHRLVHEILKDEFAYGLHACSMHLATPEEWKQNTSVIDSPVCAHLSKNES
jgi:BolA family transcriptional regulator, general stress-responsive regulator